jgi:hypothetical protein
MESVTITKVFSEIFSMFKKILIRYYNSALFFELMCGK